MLKKKELTLFQKRIITVILLFLVTAFSIIICFFVGKPLIKFVTKPEKFRSWVDSHGILSRLAFVGMVFFQVIVAVIPGEPFEIGAGYAFGIIEGTLLVLIGILLGSIVIFWLVRTVGIKMVEVFFPIEKIRSLKFIKDSKKLNLITFIVFLIPGTPKDLLSYFIGLTDISFGFWLFVATAARLPSVLTSVISGNALGVGKYSLGIIFLVSTALISLTGLLIYKKFQAHFNTN